jgi:hypothetical protein
MAVGPLFHQAHLETMWSILKLKQDGEKEGNCKHIGTDFQDIINFLHLPNSFTHGGGEGESGICEMLGLFRRLKIDPLGLHF